LNVLPFAAYPFVNGLFCFTVLVMNFTAPVLDLLVDGRHARDAERPGVLDAAVGIGVDHAARAVLLLELRILRVVVALGLLFGIQVIKVAEELVEAVRGGQVLVAVAQVVLAELAGRVVSPTASLGNPARADPAADRRRTATSCYRRLKNPLKSLAFWQTVRYPTMSVAIVVLSRRFRLSHCPPSAG
jgi:hypothetical protein